MKETFVVNEKNKEILGRLKFRVPSLSKSVRNKLRSKKEEVDPIKKR
jgi:hypothetical protein